MLTNPAHQPVLPPARRRHETRDGSDKVLRQSVLEMACDHAAVEAELVVVGTGVASKSVSCGGCHMKMVIIIWNG
jgi:hypothetical protein